MRGACKGIVEAMGSGKCMASCDAGLIMMA